MNPKVSPLDAAADAWTGMKMTNLYKVDADRFRGQARAGVAAYLAAQPNVCNGICGHDRCRAIGDMLKKLERETP